MESFFSSTEKKPFILSQNLPQNYRGLVLTGSKNSHAQGKSGEVFFQELEGENYLARYICFEWKKKITISFKDKNSHVHLFIAVHNDFRFYFKSRGEIKLGE